jgi:hypothetical protein
VVLHVITHIFQNLTYANIKVWGRFTCIIGLWIIISVNILLVKICGHTYCSTKMSWEVHFVEEYMLRAQVLSL